jgi:hypothetical protein
LADNTPWTPQRDKQLRELWKRKDITVMDMADIMGMKVDRVSKRARITLQLPARPRRLPTNHPHMTSARAAEIAAASGPMFEPRNAEHVAAIASVMPQGFPALSEQLLWERGAKREFACVLPVIWPLLERAA